MEYYYMKKNMDMNIVLLKKEPLEVKCLIDLDENEELKMMINNYSAPSETPIIFKIRTKSIDETKKEEDGSLS